MTDDLLAAVRDLPKACKYLHVPAQSGSNRMLQRMKRGYTIEDYREMHNRIREWLPEAAVTSDFIVGFSGETDEDFELSCDLVRECRFKNSFIFKYSVRPGTKGANLYADDIPEETKRVRNNELLAIQNEICEADNQRFLGQQVSILVEGRSKAAERRDETGEATQLVGRTMCDRIVVFDGNLRQVGQTLPISIYDANAHTLFGAVVTQHVGPELFSLTT